jgi:diguanylate cyclase (GGDEF)-like protein
MSRRLQVPRLSFSAQFAIVVVLLGVALAAAVLYIPITQSSAQARQAALDRVSEQSAVALTVLRAEEGSLAAFATQSGQAAASAIDILGLVQRLSAATSPQDIVGVASAGSGAVAAGGQILPADTMRWVMQAAGAGDGVAADASGHPWIVGSTPVPGRPAMFVFVARDMSRSELAVVAAGTPGYGSTGFAIVRDGRLALPGRVASTAGEAGMPLTGGLTGPASADGPSAVVSTSTGDVAGASTPIGGGFRLLVTAGVLDARSLADDIPVVVVTIALVLLALVFIYGLVRRDLQRPLGRLDAAVSAMGREEYDVPVTGRSDDALGRVTDSFVAMRTELRSLMRAAEARVEIATDLSSLASTDSALRQVCERLRRATDAQLAVIVIAGRDGRPAALHAAGLPQPRDPNALLTGAGVIAAAAKSPGPGAVLACPLSGPEVDLGLDEICAAPLRVGVIDQGVLAIGDTRASAGFGRHALELVEAAAEHVALAVERERVLVTARLQASTDSLTALYNRRFLTDFLEQQVAIADRSSSTFSVVMIDVDHFKSVNDQFGHEIGDESLRTVARTLSGTLRRSDLAARLGGDEFLIVMSDTSLEAAAGVAEKLRKAIAGMRVASPTTRRRARISVSIGVASRAPGGPGVDRLLTIVDDALYEAKRQGRDRVVVAQPPEPEEHPTGKGLRRPIDIAEARRVRSGGGGE